MSPEPTELRELELRRIELDLVTPFRTSFGSEARRDILLVRVRTDAGDGWGECVAMREPAYSAEFVEGASLVITDWLWPKLVAGGPLTAADVAPRLERFQGHPMAKGAIEMAMLDADLRRLGVCYRDWLGTTATTVPSGVSVGIFESIDELLRNVEGYVDDGYARIKLKIEPGWDIEPVRRVRELIGPDLGLQVDANTAYRRTDGEHLARLDEFDLLLIEQPLAEDDIVGHARLAERVETPICLDESIVSVRTAVDAIELGAAEVVNIKPGRVGGYLEAQRIHDACRAAGVAVWCGGMVETGIGRAANAALATLPGFTLVGDISAASRFYRRDIVTEPITMHDGVVDVPTGPGLGFDLDLDHLDSVTTSITRLTVD